VRRDGRQRLLHVLGLFRPEYALAILALSLLLPRAAPAQTTYIERDTVVTCGTNGTDGSLQASTGGAVSRTITAAPSGTTQQTLFTGAGHPNSTSWNGSGSYTIKLKITAGCSGSPSLAVQLSRYPAACGAAAETVASTTVTCAVGVQTVTPTATFAGPVGCSDLLGLDIVLTELTGLGSTSVTYELNVSPNDTVATPITEGTGCGAAAATPLRMLMGVGQ